MNIETQYVYCNTAGTVTTLNIACIFLFLVKIYFIAGIPREFK